MMVHRRLQQKCGEKSGLARAESAIAFSWLHPEAAKAINQVNPVILSKECFIITYYQ